MSATATKRRTLDQRRAGHALKQIRNIEKSNDGYYCSYVSALPATIVINGLGQALATQLAKAKKGRDHDSHRLLYNHVASWLTTHMKQELGDDPEQLLERLMLEDQSVYLRAQAEAMAYLNWLKQFARAYLNEKEGQGA